MAEINTMLQINYAPIKKKKTSPGSLELRSWSEVQLLSHVQLFATPWTIAYKAPPSMEFSK